MRTCLLAAATLLLAVSSGCNCLDLHQGMAEQPRGGQRACPQCEQAALFAQQQEAALLAQQQQAWLLAQQQAAAGDVQLVAYPMPCPSGGPGYGDRGYGPYDGAGGQAGHPGRLFDGGYYGWHGSPHGTPGYPRRHHMQREYVGPQGPPTAQVAYPYYTVRGPRDFLIDNPPSIGR